MPPLTGLFVILTVNDADRSAAWYCEVLGLSEAGRYVRPDGHVAQVNLTDPRSTVELCLVGHDEDSGTFSEYRAGLDHLEFLVPRRSDLDAWALELDARGIRHSGVKEPSYTSNAMLTFRDPDNIQLEFFWRGPASSTQSSLSGSQAWLFGARVSLAARSRTWSTRPPTRRRRRDSQ